MLIRVLAIDDDPKFSRLLKVNLERHGEFKVHVVNDPLKALDVARRFRPEIILLDIIMPEMDGGEVLLQIQRDPDLHRVPVVMLTALLTEGSGDQGTDPQDEEMAFISKPVDMDVLTRTMRRVLKQATAVPGVSA